MPLDRFNLYSSGLKRIKNIDRLDYIHDLVSAVGGVLGGSEGLEDHVETLLEKVNGSG